MDDDIKFIYDKVCEYEPKIMRFFRSRVSDDDVVEDLAQESLFQAIKAADRFRRESSISTWIYAICKNTLFTHYYKKKKSELLFQKLKCSNESVDSEEIDIKTFIDRLDKPFSVIYDLYYKKGYKIKEMARMLSRPEGTIKYLLYTLRIRLKEYLQRDKS